MFNWYQLSLILNLLGAFFLAAENFDASQRFWNWLVGWHKRIFPIDADSSDEKFLQASGNMARVVFLCMFVIFGLPICAGFIYGSLYLMEQYPVWWGIIFSIICMFIGGVPLLIVLMIVGPIIIHGILQLTDRIFGARRPLSGAGASFLMVGFLIQFILSFLAS